MSTKIDELRRLETQAATLRRELKLDSPGEVVWYAEACKDRIEVRADGYGHFSVERFEPWGAEVLHKESAGPFDTAEAAIAVARRMYDGDGDDGGDDDDHHHGGF